MNPTRLRRHTALVSAVCLVAGMLLATAPAHGAPGADTAEPEQLTAAEVESALEEAEASAAASSTRALDTETAAERARTDADAAGAHAASLASRSEAADAELAQRTARAGAVAAGLYRTTSSAPLLARVLTSADPETLLARLGTMERLTEASASLVGGARAAANLTASQRAQASLAQTEYERLLTAADTAAAAARSEAAAEGAAVAAAQVELDGLYARLAALTRTSAAQAKTQRLEHQVAEQAASRPGASGGGSGGSAGGAAPAVPALPDPPAPPPSAPTPPPPPQPAPDTGIAPPAQAQAIARSALGARGWGDDQFSCLVRLWNRESGWRVQARNPSSGAYGIPQASPAEKMASAGPDWRTSASTQIAWGLSYIGQVHGSPCGAWDHSERTGWY